MSYLIAYWDEEAQEQRERLSTPEEDAQRALDIAAAAIPVVPAEVPMLNARLALIGAGWMDGVTAYLQSLPGVEGEQARAYFDYAQNIRRDHPLVTSIPEALGKTPEEVDMLFVMASRIVL